MSPGDSGVIFSTEKGLRRMYWASLTSPADMHEPEICQEMTHLLEP